MNYRFPSGGRLQRFDACFNRRPAGQIVVHNPLYDHKGMAVADDQHVPHLWDGHEWPRFAWDFAFAFRIVIIVYGVDDIAKLPLVSNFMCMAQANAYMRMVYVTTSSELAHVLKSKGIGVVLLQSSEAGTPAKIRHFGN